MYERFAVDVKVDNEPVVAYYAFCEAPKSFLDTPIPQAALDQVYGTGEDGEPIKTDVTLKDFALSYADLDDTVIVTLGAQFAPTYRTRVVNEQDLADWDGFMTPHGFDSSKWMTKEERQQRLAEVTGDAL